MNSLNGDVAVARLDAAVEAFLDIMTAPERTMVPVPEHAPQPSLAERARVNLKPSTDEAARQALAAEASAKAAQEAADRANQITGLPTVFDAIEVAAVPLPDVWAPLTDSLRLFTGRGREVKVGDDVVASYLTYARASGATYTGKDGLPKSAAVNEPRFERAGLLLEDKKTNLVYPASDLTRWASRVGYEVTYDNAEGACKIVPAAGGAPKAVICKRGAVFPASTSTWRAVAVTVEVKPAGFDMVVIGFIGADEASPDNGIGVNVHTGALVKANHNLTVNKVVRLPNGYTRITVATRNYDDARATHRDVVIGCGDAARPYAAFSAPSADGVKGMHVRFVQCEEAEQSSSNIPTDNRAVTRAADMLSLPTPLNFPGSRGDMTLAVEVLRDASIHFTHAQPIAWIGEYTWLRCGCDDFIAYGGSQNAAILKKPAHGEHETVVLRIKGDEVTIYCGGEYRSVTRTGELYDNNALTYFGSNGKTFFANTIHLRNLRVWHRALNDAQMKAIK